MTTKSRLTADLDRRVEPPAELPAESLADRAAEFAAEVEQASAANLSACLQCGKCSSGCPVAAQADIVPHALLRLVQLGQHDEVLSSRMIWLCTSCQTCMTRCPQKVDIAAMNDALRRMSLAANLICTGTNVPTFNDTFLRIVRRLGRMYEVGLMTAYKLRTRDFMSDTDKVPTMLRKGKLALLPPMIGGGRERRRLFDRVHRAGGQKP
jgi:heterodisulfide reductase subunit C